MELLILVVVLALLGFAAQRWGVDTRPTELDSAETIQYGIA
jgi:hypothetical protein